MQNFGPVYGKINKIDEKLNSLKQEKKEQDKVLNTTIAIFLIFLSLFIYVSGYNSGLIKGSKIKDNNVLYFLKK